MERKEGFEILDKRAEPQKIKPKALEILLNEFGGVQDDGLMSICVLYGLYNAGISDWERGLSDKLTADLCDAYNKPVVKNKSELVRWLKDDIEKWIDVEKLTLK